MVNIFTAFLFTSIVGTLLAFFLALIRPLTQKVFSPGWHYYAWLIVLFVMILPIRFDVSQVEGIIPVTNSSTISHYISESISESQLIDVINEENFTPSKTPIISTFSKPFKILWDKNASTFACIWLIVCLGLFFIRLSCYITFTYNVKKSSKLIKLPLLSQYTNHKLCVRTNSSIVSPLLIGLFRPTLLLPEKPLSPDQLHNILVHEITHLHRHDLAYKWFISLLKCIHWFNPIIYWISNQIDVDCEISCDLAAVKGMNAEDEKRYMETLLTLLTSKKYNLAPLSTSMSVNAKTLKKRFRMIRNKKEISKKACISSGIVALSLLIVSLLASGTFAGSILGNVPDDDLTDSEAISNAQQQQTEAVLNVESEFYVSDTLTNSTSNLGNNSEHVPSTNRENTSKNTDANVNALTSTSISGKDVQLDISINTAQGLSNTSFIWPADSKRISNSFGTRVHPITNEVQTHNGVDILAEEGANVYASIKGNVIEAAFDKQDGNYIIIENAHGICTKYSQLSSIDVSVGDSVTQGHIIGKVGKTGKATGAHLHFSIKADGKYYDPMQLAN